MVNLFAIVLIAAASSAAPSAARADSLQSSRPALSVPAPAAPRLTAKQKAWFAHAVDHILEGK